MLNDAFVKIFSLRSYLAISFGFNDSLNGEYLLDEIIVLLKHAPFCVDSSIKYLLHVAITHPESPEMSIPLIGSDYKRTSESWINTFSFLPN
jgi:hypothetical protein